MFWTNLCRFANSRYYFKMKEKSWGSTKEKSKINTVFDVVQSSPLSSPPINLGKVWSLIILLKKNYIENFRIRNYFKNIFLIFLFIMYDTAII